MQETANYMNTASTQMLYITPEHSKLHSDHIFVPDNYEHIRVELKDVLYIQADGSYIMIFTQDKMYQLSMNLKRFSEQISFSSFHRISRQHLINLSYLMRVNCVKVELKNKHGNEVSLPISKQKRSELLSVLPVLKL